MRLYDAAIDAWKLYQHYANPAPVRFNTTYYTFERQGIPFFLLDTRTYRSLKIAKDDADKTMLGEQQLEDLFTWLDENKAADFKIVVSSCPFTKNWRGVDALDTWAGYLHERKYVLEKFWEAGNVIILSGDRHEAAAIKFPPPDLIDDARTVYEFSTSPFSQFYIPIPTHRQMDNEDITLVYKPNGNSKVGQYPVENMLRKLLIKLGRVTIDSKPNGKSELYYELFIDGEEVWNYAIISK